MPKSRPPDSPEFGLGRFVWSARRSAPWPGWRLSLRCSAESLRDWINQADLDQVRRADGMTSEELLELTRLRRRVADPRARVKILKRGPGSPRRAARSRAGFEFVEAHQADFSVVTVCRVLSLSRSAQISAAVDTMWECRSHSTCSPAGRPTPATRPANEGRGRTLNADLAGVETDEIPTLRSRMRP